MIVSHCVVRDSIDRGHDFYSDDILGIDGCISYWPPPLKSCRIRKYDPHTNHTALVGKDFFGSEDHKQWYGGCLASDGVIYCISYNAIRVLSIDSWKEYISSMKNGMEEHPQQVGLLFHPSIDIPDVTNFDHAVTKIGRKKVLKAALADYMPPADRLCAFSNLHDHGILRGEQ